MEKISGNPMTLDRFKKLFSPPIFPDDPEKTRIAALLSSMLWTLTVVLIAVLAGIILGSVTRFNYAVSITLVLLLFVIGLHIPLHRGHVKQASTILVVVITVGVTVYLIVLGTLRAPAVVYYVFSCMIAGLLIGRRAAVITAIVICCIALGLLYAEAHSYLPEPITRISATQGVTIVVGIFLSVRLLNLALHSIDEALDRARYELSEREKAESALRQLSDAAVEGIAITHQGSVILANKRLAEMLDYEPSEPIGKSVIDFVAPESTELVLEQVRSGYEGVYEHLALRKDGSVFPVEAQGRVMSYRGLTVRVTSIRDITERKKTEKAIFDLNVELETKATQMATLNEIARDISVVTDLTTTLKRVLSELQATLPLDSFFVALLDPDTQMITFPIMYDAGQFWDQQTGQLSHSSWAADVLKTGQPILISRTPDEIEADRKLNTRLGDVGQVSASVLMVPLSIDDAHIGVISVQSYALNAYNQKHLDLLMGAAYQIAIAVENARLYDSLQSELAERKRAEESVKRSETHLRALLDATTDVAFLISHDGVFLTLNEAMATPWGKVEELIGQNVFDVIESDIGAERYTKFQKMIQSGKPARWVDESPRGWWDNSVYPILSPAGSVEAFAIYSRNITEQKRLEAELQTYANELEKLVDERTNALRRAKEQLELVLNNTTNALAFADPRGDILVTNPAFRATFTEQGAQSIEFVLGSLASEEQIVLVSEALLKSIKQGEVQRVEVQIASQTGQKTDFDLVLIPVNMIDDASQKGVLLSGHDITPIKQIERFKARFVADAVHDLATPIAGLSTRLYMLKGSPERLSDHVRALENQVAHLRNLLDDLRTLSQLDRQQLDLIMEMGNLNELVQRVFDTYEPVAINKHQTLKLHITADVPDVHLDQRQIERVLVNLVANAVNYTPENKEIHIETALDGDDVLVEISDQGAGISMEDLPHIFERFYRTEEARKTLSSGTGLGLAITKEIVELHGGSVSATSKPGQGSIFTVRLPLCN